MIKFYQWFEFDALKEKYKDNKELSEVIESLKNSQRKIKFYEYYHVNDDIIEKNRIAAQDATETETDPKILSDHIWNLTDDVEQLRTERNYYKELLEDVNNPNTLLKKIVE